MIMTYIDIKNNVPGYSITWDHELHEWFADPVTHGGPIFRSQSLINIISSVAAEQGWGMRDEADTLADLFDNPDRWREPKIRPAL